MATTTELERFAYSLGEHARTLAAAALIEASGGRAATDDAVRQMLRRASELMRGAAALGKDANPVTLGVVARAILENLIMLLWVQVSEANASALRQSALAELARVARVNLESGKAQILNRETGEDATADFLATDRFKNLGRRMSVEARAKEAGVEDLYNIFYRSLSLEMHGHSPDSHEAEDARDLAVMHMQGIGALGTASGHAGVRWLLHRERTDNETLRALLGLSDRSPNRSFQPTASGGG